MRTDGRIVAVALFVLLAACSSGSSGGTPDASVDAAPYDATTASDTGVTPDSGGARDAGADTAPQDSGVFGPGSNGSGTVSCRGTDGGGACAKGQVCCAWDLPAEAACVSGLTACSCYASTTCLAVACEGPQDCPGQQCCLTLSGASPWFTSCRTTCAADEYRVCKLTGDCPGATAQCTTLFGSAPRVCN